MTKRAQKKPSSTTTTSSAGLPTSSEPDFRYIAFGAGVQSTALLVLSALGSVPRANCAIFADTGDEPGWVYRHLKAVKAWAQEYEIPIYECAAGVLSEDTLKRGTFVPIPVFSRGTEGDSQLRRQCTREYKITPIEKKVRELLGYEPRERVKHSVEAMIGISLDEVWRMKPSRTKWVTNTYPLVDAGLRRGDCLNVLDAAGIRRTKKSSCVYCPYHGDSYWRDLKQNHPGQWDRAVWFDDAIRDMSMQGSTRPVYVHRSLVPLAEADLNEDQTDLFGNECEGYCGV